MTMSVLRAGSISPTFLPEQEQTSGKTMSQGAELRHKEEILLQLALNAGALLSSSS